MQFAPITGTGTSTEGFVVVSACTVTMDFHFVSGSATIAVHVKNGNGGTWHAFTAGTSAAPLTGTAVEVTGSCQIAFEAHDGQRFRLYCGTASSPVVNISAGGTGVMSQAAIADY